jgi:hypothetical protein
MKMILIHLLSFILLGTSCSRKDKPNNENGTGYIRGQVTDTKGLPLPNVNILIDNTLIFNSFLSGTTAADGKYSIKLVNGAWMAYASMNVDLNGKTYKVQLHPENTNGFGIEGGTRNFTWRLKGKKPTPLTGNYGGTIIIDKAVLSSIFDSENIEFTLIPVGKLIDGSIGETIVMKHGLPTTETYGILADIPIGRYAITAVYKSTAGNTPIKLKNKLIPNAVASSRIEIDFEPSSPVGDNMAVLEYSE